MGSIKPLKTSEKKKIQKSSIFESVAFSVLVFSSLSAIMGKQQGF